MNLLTLSWKNITTRPLGALLSITLLGLSIMLISLMLHVEKQFGKTLNRNIQGVDMVLGAKGSPLQLILSSVFQIDAPTGNISMAAANKLTKNPLVKNAIPLAYGDSYQGFRIVGTETDYLVLYQAKLHKGSIFQKSFEVVVGATVAQQLKLKVGSTFHSQHGFEEEGEAHDDHEFKVVGILKPNGTVVDKLLLTPLASVWDSHNHAEHESEHEEDEHKHDDGEHHHADGDEHKHDDDEHHHADGGEHKHDEKEHHHKDEEGHKHEDAADKEITAMFIQFRSPMAMMQLPRYVNEKTTMQAALPSYEVSRLFQLMEGAIRLMQILAVFIMLVSCFSIFISLYNAIKERKYEMALLRNFGASRWQLVRLVLQEGLLLTSLGFAAGILFSRLAFWGFSVLSYSVYQFHFTTEWFLIEELYLMFSMVLLGAFASILPAIQVFRLQVSNVLAEQ